MYWKFVNEDKIYWSNENNNPKKTLSFNNQKMYFDHRAENNFKKDWSNIKVLKNDKNKGMYWKFKNEDSVYWSNEDNNPKKTVIFTSKKMFFNHRIKNGCKNDWSNIKEFTNKDPTEKDPINKDPINKDTKTGYKGMYWKFDDDGTVYWSDQKDKPIMTIIFDSGKKYLNHRIENNCKKDWSNIKVFPNKINKGMYWKFKNEGTVYWSNKKDKPNKTIIFTSQKMYFDHRFKNNLKKNWSDIKTF